MISKFGKYNLNDGIPCIQNNCIKCCKETQMSLTCKDIKRISKLGFKPEDFIVETKGMYLKNKLGKCVFLLEDRCKIYGSRPEGCKLYPLVYNDETKNTLLDNYCPFREYFKVKKSDIKKIKNLIKEIDSKTLHYF
jgi:Fe-S-cluster containining protein